MWPAYFYCWSCDSFFFNVSHVLESSESWMYYSNYRYRCVRLPNLPHSALTKDTMTWFPCGDEILSRAIKKYELSVMQCCSFWSRCVIHYTWAWNTWGQWRLASFVNTVHQCISWLTVHIRAITDNLPEITCPQSSRLLFHTVLLSLWTPSEATLSLTRT